VSSVPATGVAGRIDRSTVLKLLSYAPIFFLILYARRSAQLLHPQVWDEDGLVIMRDLIQAGPASILWPLNGYLLVIPRTITFLALSVSVSYYPLISTLLAWAFTIAALIAISVSPLALRGGVLLAIAAGLVPSDPEVFGLPLYTFWWAGLLVVAAAFWRPQGGATAWRLAFVASGGLSSPVILLALPLFLCRAAMWRRDVAERIVAIAATLCAIAQIAALVQSHVVAQQSLLSTSGLLAALPMFFGNYVAGSVVRAQPQFATVIEWVVAVATLAVIAVALRTGRRHIAMLAALLYLLFGSIALSAARAPILILDPVLTGPRYFFYPFVFEAWLLLQIAFLARWRFVRWTAAAFVGLAVLNAIPALSRPHDDLRWLANVRNCAQVGDTEVYGIPVEFDGRAASAWVLQLSGAHCRILASRDLLARFAPTDAALVPPFAVHDPPPPGAFTSIASVRTVVSNGWNGTDLQHSLLPGFVVIGSYRSGDADTGALKLRLHRGDRILYRSPVARRQRIIVEGAAPARFDTVLPNAPDWIVLDFSNRRLPDDFIVLLEDEGTGPGEWSAVALLNA
jgi:hypothetical protein